MVIERSGNDPARAAWNKRPVGFQRSTSPPGEARYFEELRRYRYEYETPFITRFFDFASLEAKSVLEIGVGNGIDAVEIASNGASYAGIDITERHLELTRQHFRLRLGREPRLWKGDLLDIQLTERFDVIYSFGVLHHIPHEKEILASAQRLLTPGGRLMLAVYAKYSAFNLYLLLSWIFRNRMRAGFDDWRSHIAELTDLGSPVTIRIRGKAEVEALLASCGFRTIRYARRGFVQRYLPIVGQWCAPDGAVLRMLGSIFGWYHLFICEPAARASNGCRPS